MIKTRSLLAASTVAIATMAAPAFAQDFDDEIIVTATKRQTSLQDTPVAVTVTRAETIERAEIQDLIDLQSVVPSLRVSQLQASTQTDFVIRGFGNGANNPGIEPSVGVFIDGVYRSRSAASIGDLPKLERVEVLAGPQSTLFGKNASAGVVSVVTQAPQFDSQGYVEAGIGNYDLYQARAYYTGPISENVAFSLGGSIQQRDGYTKRANGGKNLNDRDRINLRGQLLFEPTDDLSIRLIGDYSRIDELCCGVVTARTSVTSNVLAGINGGTSVYSDPTQPFDRVFFGNKTPENKLDDYGFSGQVDYDFGDDLTLTSITAYRENDSFSDIDADFNSLDLLDSQERDTNLETFTQELRLTSNYDGPFNFQVGGFYFDESVKHRESIGYGSDIRAYAETLTALLGAPSVLGTIETFDPSVDAGSLFADNIRNDEFFTQDDETYSLFGTVDYEIGDRLTLTGGLNFTDVSKKVSGMATNTDPFSNLILATNPGLNVYTQGAIQQSFGVPATLSPISAAFLSTFGAPLTAANFGGLPGPAQAAFISGTQASIANGLTALQFLPPLLAFPNAVESGEINDNKVTYSLRGNYEVTEDLSVYASYSTGYKSPSFNLSRDSRPAITDAVALQSAGLLPPNYNFTVDGSGQAVPNINGAFTGRFADAEDATVYELGAKAQFSRGTINVAVFNQTLENFQTNDFIGTKFVLGNAGETEVWGVEVNGRLDILDSLTADYALTYLDPEYTDYTDAPAPGGGFRDLSGTKPANISEISLSLGLTYEHDFSNGMTGYVRGDYQYEDSVLISSSLSPDGQQASVDSGSATSPLSVGVAEFPGYENRSQNLVNVSAGLEFENGLGVQFWGRNIFGDDYFTTLFPGVAQFGVVNGYPSAPATYGVNVRKEF